MANLRRQADDFAQFEYFTNYPPLYFTTPPSGNVVAFAGACSIVMMHSINAGPGAGE